MILWLSDWRVACSWKTNCGPRLSDSKFAKFHISYAGSELLDTSQCSQFKAQELMNSQFCQTFSFNPTWIWLKLYAYSWLCFVYFALFCLLCSNKYCLGFPLLTISQSRTKKLRTLKNVPSLFSDQSKLIDLEEAAKAAEKGKWAKDAGEVLVLCLWTLDTETWFQKQRSFFV